MLNVDLHSHSDCSDGVLTPELVAARAKKNGVGAWALTDHDTVKGTPSARAAALELGLHYVSGVEISVTWAKQTIHIVGLQIDETESTLVQGLTDTRAGRMLRARDMATQLTAAGIPGSLEGALQYVTNPESISRTHFARHLVASGICPDISSVFRNYLIKGKPGYVPHRWATLQNAITWIRNAGGIAVVAHPGRYKLDAIALDAFLSEFKELGGSAIEVVTGSHTVDQYQQYAKIAQHYGLLASRGSDFHSSTESRVDLGTLPALPENVTPVWHDWF